MLRHLVFLTLLLAQAGSHDGVELVDDAGAKIAIGDRITVVVFIGVDCPLTSLYTDRLNELSSGYGDTVHFVAIDSNRLDTSEEIETFRRRQRIRYPIIKDIDHRLSGRFDATRTPEVILFDEHGTIRYRGQIDDQYQPGSDRGRSSRPYLRQAIDALLSGRPVPVPNTEPVGCFIDGKKQGKSGSELGLTPSRVTYSKDIAPIFRRRCVECHREGQVAPFPLNTFEEAEARSETIAWVIDAGRMPPWGADPRYGTFANDRSLTAEERRLILEWAKDGAPQGDPADLTPAPPSRRTVG
jgi:hypothetical protein